VLSPPAERDDLAFRTAVGGGAGLVIQPRGGAIRGAAETDLRPSGRTRSAERSSP
jgi:hypothetical protein